MTSLLWWPGCAAQKRYYQGRGAQAQLEAKRLEGEVDRWLRENEGRLTTEKGNGA